MHLRGSKLKHNVNFMSHRKEKKEGKRKKFFYFIFRFPPEAERFFTPIRMRHLNNASFYSFRFFVKNIIVYIFLTKIREAKFNLSTNLNYIVYFHRPLKIVRARIVSGSIIFWFRTIAVIIRVIGFPLSSHTLSPLSSVYKVVHVRSGVRRRVRARSGAGGSLLTFCLRLLRCCLFLSKSSSIYSGIWVLDLAPGISPLERSNGSGGDSVSTGFVVRRWIGGSR